MAINIRAAKQAISGPSGAPSLQKTTAVSCWPGSNVNTVCLGDLVNDGLTKRAGEKGMVGETDKGKKRRGKAESSMVLDNANAEDS